MADLSTQVEGHVVLLRSALQSSDDIQTDRECQNLEDILLRDNAYQFIGDERLLAEVNNLLTQALGQSTTDYLSGLRHHLANLHIIHDKFYAILSPNIDLDTLLLTHLAYWPFLEKPVECNFNSVLDKLHAARTDGNNEQKLRTFSNIYLSHLKAEDFTEVVSILEPLIQLALDGYRHLRNWQVYGLFASREQGSVYGLQVKMMPSGEGKIRAVNSVRPEMETAANSAVSYINGLYYQSRNWDFQWELGRDDIQFDGRSIGLGLTMAILASIENFDIDVYTAFTGCVDWEGNVKRIEDLDVKLQAAQALGIRRVFIPQENSDDYILVEGLEIIPVESISVAKQQLQNQLYLQASTDLKRLAESKIQQLEIELKAKGIRKVSQNQHPNSCIKVEFTDGRDVVPVSVYHAQQIKCVVQGKESNLQRLIGSISDNVFGTKPTPSPNSASGKQLTHKFTVREQNLQQRLESHLFRRGDAVRETENNCIYRAKIIKGGQTVLVRQFTNGTLTIAGISPLLDEIDAEVRAIIGVVDIPAFQDNTSEASRKEAQIAAVKAIELGDRWIGTDESGKGDYFGPLVGAAVMVDEQLALELAGLGVKDSKALSDNRNQELAETIRQICGKRAQVVVIPPERYNPLYEQFQLEGKNLNTLLAWAHTRALEDILKEFPQDQITVIVDKFGDEHFIKSKLLSQGRKTNLNLIQLPKAEANIAVAAASILARAQFLQHLKRMSVQYGIEFPKGSSDPRIVQVGKQIVASRGRDELRKVAKLHFTTTQKIL